MLFNKKILLDRIIEPVEVVSLVVNSCFFYSPYRFLFFFTFTIPILRLCSGTVFETVSLTINHFTMKDSRDMYATVKGTTAGQKDNSVIG